MLTNFKATITTVYFIKTIILSLDSINSNLHLKYYSALMNCFEIKVSFNLPFSIHFA